MNSTLGARLQAWRETACLTQLQASAVFGCTETSYRNWEADRVPPVGRDKAFGRRVENLLRKFEEEASHER